MDSSIRATLMGGVAEDQNQRHAFQIAFYNTICFALLGVCLLGLYAIYQMLHMFLTPLLWAVLVGTVIFPLKRHISATLGGWLERLHEQGTPLVIGIAMLPLGVAARISNTVYDTAFSQTGTMCAAAYLTLKILSFDGVLVAIFNRLGRFYLFVDAGIDFFTQRWLAAVLLPYAAAYVAYICVQDHSRLRKKPTRLLSLPIWIFLLAHLSNFFGLLRVLIFISTSTLLALISAGLIAVGRNGVEAGNADDAATEEEGDVAAGDSETGRYTQLAPALPASGNSFDESRLDKALSGDNNLRIVAALCLLLLVARHDVLLIIILVPFFAAAAMRAGERLGLNNVVESSIQQAWQWTAERLEKPVNVVVAGSLRKFVTLLFTSDRMFISGLKGRVDFIATNVVMVGLAVGTVLATFLVCFQIHNETVHLVRLGKEVLTSHPEWISTALNYTEGQLREHDIDQYIDKAYQQGREWLSSNIRSIADPKDPERADQLEQQVNLLLDNLYRLWGERNNSSCPDGQSALTRQGAHEGDWMKQIMSATNIETLRKELTGVISQNLEMIISIARSIWGVVLANLSLLTTVLLSIAWFVFGFGMDLLNLFIEAVVFLTVAYYLLANSNDEWLPLKWINNLIPSLSQMSNIRKTDRESIGQAVENAISGVFVLSAKMSIFYALHTYFVHSLFGLHIVFIPSMLASLFAAIPIVPPYVVCALGFVELFLVRGESFAGITFIALSVAPLFIADAAFYREIKGSHPYVTGLAVIGGIYWMGATGAIIGPIILCCMLILVNIYSELAAKGGE